MKVLLLFVLLLIMPVEAQVSFDRVDGCQPTVKLARGEFYGLSDIDANFNKHQVTCTYYRLFKAPPKEFRTSVADYMAYRTFDYQTGAPVAYLFKRYEIAVNPQKTALKLTYR